MCSTCFGHKYIHHQELATILLNYYIGCIVLVSMCVGVAVWLVWSGIRDAGFKMFRTLIYPSSGACDYSVELIQQNSRKLLTMDILMSETCWAHKKWNKLASDIKLVFYSSTITMMHGPINIRCINPVQYTDGWRAVVNTVMNIRVPEKKNRQRFLDQLRNNYSLSTTPFNLIIIIVTIIVLLTKNPSQHPSAGNFHPPQINGVHIILQSNSTFIS